MVLPNRKPSSSYSLLKFVYVTSQLRHSLVVHPLLRKILDPPLGVDIHKQILKVAPYRGLTIPGHNYTGPGNPLHDQLRHDDEGNILEIYQQPTGPTDAVSMQHDVDYTVCGNKPKSEQLKCKHTADKKMVKSLDAIPWKDRQWGHTLARTMINTKQKLGLGIQKNARRR